MKFEEIKVGQLLGASFPFYEPNIKHEFKVVKVFRTTRTIKAINIKTSQTEVFVFPPSKDYPNWHIIEDIV